MGAGLGVFTRFAGLGVETLEAEDLVALATAGLGVREAEDLVILETAGLGVRVFAAELAVARVRDRGVLSLTAGLGVLVFVADVKDLVFLFGVVSTGVEEADLEGVATGCDGVVVSGVALTDVAGDSVTVLAVGDEATAAAFVGDFADPLAAWQAVQNLRARGFEQPHAAQDQMPVFSVKPLP